jgi:hypothetical protein
MLEQLITSFPTKQWNFRKLSTNPNITPNIIEKFINKDWNWTELSCNQNIDINFIKKYINKNWDWNYIFRYKHLDINFIENIRTEINIEWSILSKNKNIDIDFIKKYENLLDLYNLCYYNPNLTKEYIIENLNKNIEIPDFYQQQIIYNPFESFYGIISRNEQSSLTFEIIENYPDIKWDYFILTSNINIPIDFIKKNLDKNFNWYHLSLTVDIETIFENIELPWKYIYISKNSNLREHHIIKYKDKINWDWNSLLLNGNISIDFIMDHKENDYQIEYGLIYSCLTSKFISSNINKPFWNFNELSKHPSITLNIVKNNKNKEWNWGKLSKYLKINIEDVLENNDLPWNWNKLSKNTYLTIGMKCIIKYPHLPWNWYYLSESPNITIDFIKKYSNINNLDYVDWNILSKNLLKKHPKFIIMEESVSNIKNMWKILLAKRDLKRRKMNYLIKYKSPFKNFLGGIEYIKHKELFEKLK